jgi:hypothetical protein
MKTPDRTRPALLPLLVLAAAHPEEAGRLLEVLRRWVELEGGGSGSLRAAEEVERHLRAVGYR